MGMRLTDEQVMQDNKRFANCNALAELKYCGWDIPHRKSITNDEIHFYAWLCRSALALLKEQQSLLGIQQAADGITFISTGTAKQGEERGILLGKLLMNEWIYKELLYKGLLTDDIRSVLEQAKHI